MFSIVTAEMIDIKPAGSSRACRKTKRHKDTILLLFSKTIIDFMLAKF